MAAPGETYSSSDEGFPIGDITQPTAAQIEAEMFEDWVETFTQPRDAIIAEMFGDIVRVKAEFNRYAAVSPNVAPMMTHFAQENSKLTAKIKQREAQLDLVTDFANGAKYREEDCEHYICVICCEFFGIDFIWQGDTHYDIDDIDDNDIEAARCGHDRTFRRRCSVCLFLHT